MTSLILASKSPVRAALLTAAGLSFEVVGSGVDEAPIKARMLDGGASPPMIARALASAKAEAVSRTRPGLVIGADQTASSGGALFDKAESLEAARARLISLRGREHQLHSAVVTARSGRLLWSETVTANLTMRAFSDGFLDRYLARNGGAALGAVGGYELENEGVQLFDRIDGDYFAILGLPMLGLLEQLRAEGWIER